MACELLFDVLCDIGDLGGREGGREGEREGEREGGRISLERGGRSSEKTAA